MPQPLTPQPINVGSETSTASLQLGNIQGDVIIGLQKNYESFILFEITDIPAFKKTLAQVAGKITSTELVIAREFQLRDHKAQGNEEPLSLVGLNLGFTSIGLEKLIPNADLGDASYASGAVSRAPSLLDPVDGAGKPAWKPVFLDPGLDGVFLVTGGTLDSVQDEVDSLEALLGSAITVKSSEIGKVRPGADRGHEHFGWLDGVSQPGVKGVSDPGFPGQDLLDPGLFVFGYPIDQSGAVPPLPNPWMQDGSFMVLRRLNQLVPELNEFLLTARITDAAGNVVSMDPVLLGARMVGRWKSGAPLALTPTQDDPRLGGDAEQNNNFNLSDDQSQRRCPFSAHIRKVNPRADLPPEAVNPRRIIRAGIPFGDEVSDAETAGNTTSQERGLMFVCYQTSIINQFEFLQQAWVNNPNFVRPATGVDPLIGQVGPGVPRSSSESVPNYPIGNFQSTLNLQTFIVPTGGAYFFMPSILTLKTVLAS